MRLTLILLVLAGLISPRAADFAKWEKEISAFESADRAHASPTNAILFVGSSSIRLWSNLHEAFPNHTIIQRGFGGSTMADALHFLDRLVLKHKPRHVLVYEGDNDIANGTKAEQVVAEFKELTARIHAELPKTKISFLAIKPSPSRAKFENEQRATNNGIKRFARWNRKVEFIDTWTPMLGEDGKPRPEFFKKDNLHLNAAGYEAWTQVIRKHLK